MAGVIGGAATQGQTLTAILSDADLPTSSVTYQWLADNMPINGATANEYVLTQAEVGSTVTVAITYTDSFFPVGGSPSSQTITSGAISVTNVE